jgi:hypothetical protein
MSGPTPFMIKQARKQGKKHNIRASDLLDLMEYESNFTPGAVSSANAQGLTQFIPSTAQAYGVQYGTSKKAQKTQIKGAAKYLDDLGWGSGSPAEIREALAGYYGAASPYADRLIQSEAYSQYDKKNVALPGMGDRKSKGSPAKTKKIQTQAAVDNSAQRAQLALSFVQDEEKDFTDYLSFSEGMKSLKDQKAQFKQVQVGGKPSGKKASKGAAKTSSDTPLGAKSGNILSAAKLAEKMGLTVGEHPKYGGVAPVHATNSFHYSGRAIDVSGSPELMRKFAHRVAKKYGTKLAELFWQGAGGINIDNGSKVAQGYVSGHVDHVHVAI